MNLFKKKKVNRKFGGLPPVELKVKMPQVKPIKNEEKEEEEEVNKQTNQDEK